MTKIDKHECVSKKYELVFRCEECGIVLLALDLNAESLNDIEKELVKALIKFKEDSNVEKD